ncbi:MAG: DUF3793 family protein [Negativicutes bacterium]|nr:DUF3793 family protein [Negativicutes bacterium]
MNSILLRRFHRVLGGLDDRAYLLAKISYEVAPTSFGIKPSSLLSFHSYSRKLRQIWDQYKNDVCKELNINYFELNKTAKHTLVLFYHHDVLEKTVQDPNNKAFLEKMGYESELKLEQILGMLQRKMGSIFPHEIGLLLGIPRKDIVGFITNNGADCLFCGYWKVYHNPEQADSLFQGYDRAKNHVLRRLFAMRGAVSA